MEAADLGDGKSAVDRGGDLGLRAPREGEGEEAALEFCFGLGGQTGHGCADIGQNDRLAEEGNRLGRSRTGFGHDDRLGLGRSRRGLRFYRSGCDGWSLGYGGRSKGSSRCRLLGALLKSNLLSWSWLVGGRRLPTGTTDEQRDGKKGDAENLACHDLSFIMLAMMTRVASVARIVRRSAVVIVVVGLAGCDLLTVSQTGRSIREGNAAVVRGEVQKALQHFETALDGSMLSAEAHYRLGMLYEDQLKNEIGALHHFERYLELAPQGQFATDVKGYVDRLRLLIVSSAAEGAVMPAREASRLKNENLALRQQLTDLRQKADPAGRQQSPAGAPTPAPVTPPAVPAMTVAATPPPTPAPGPALAVSGEPEVRRALPVSAAGPASGLVVSAAPRPEPAAAAGNAVRTHKVVSGDTLAGIARKFYQNSGQWPKILEANKGTLEDPTKLKPGMILVIPE